MRKYKEDCFSYIEKNGKGKCRGTICTTCANCAFYKNKQDYIVECMTLYGVDWKFNCATDTEA